MLCGCGCGTLETCNDGLLLFGALCTLIRNGESILETMPTRLEAVCVFAMGGVTTEGGDAAGCVDAVHVVSPSCTACLPSPLPAAAFASLS